jgi:hypothetical protein
MIGKTGVVAGIIVVGSVLAAITQGSAFWHDYGWITQKDYREHHAGVVSTQQVGEIYDLLEGIKKGQEDNRDEWECDELDEEILTVELQLAEATTNTEKVTLRRQLEKMRERWDKIDCSRFEDDT